VTLVSPTHLLFIGVIALIVLGPKRLPELARSLGHGLRELREGIEGVTHETTAHEPVPASPPPPPAPPPAPAPVAMQPAPVPPIVPPADPPAG
jgi:sec-independent protein translocase protein TatA